ncbi:hypothetical protein [uncultured Thiodictyon sp.]|uniref:phage tail tube protein n=1 Tax=uncultured Thiodictyon sp. TaxID=1846217 RepID=UPI002600390A|nr:hypothetical protein [uncultured Thiodictyon sp.]
MTVSASAFVFSGDLYIDRLTDAGVSTGFLDVSNATQLAIGETTDIKTQLSKMRATRGQVLATVATKKPATLKLTLNQIDKDKLAMALLGSVSILTQGAATIGAGTPTALTLIPGRWVQMPHTNITAHAAGTSPIVITKTAGSVNVPLTDVEFNLRQGLVKYVGTSLTAATACTMTYKYGSVAGYTISGSTTPTIKATLLLDGLNVVDGTSVILTIDEATLTPSKEIDFLADDFATLEMTGEMRTLSGKSAPYTVELINAA